jgi:hypothetical protein
MKTKTYRLILLVFLALFATSFLMGCSSCESKSELSSPSLDNLKKWKGYLNIKIAPPGARLPTTRTQISNVSREMAAAKINQALESYNEQFSFRLSTVYQIAKTDKSEGGDGGPAITQVVIKGHQYHIAMLDLPSEETNRAAYEAVGKKIVAIGVADAEDETRPAWIRTKTEDGKPYAITLYLGSQAAVDSNNIYRFIRKFQDGKYATYGAHRIDNPTLEVDDNWAPFFTATYVKEDGYGEFGEGWWAEKLVLVDAQTQKLQEFLLDDPNTKDKNERDPKIPEWIDQIYSEKVLLDLITYWGYNVDNYGKTSKINEFHVDDDELYPVMNEANTNLVFSAYITSTQPDTSTSGIIFADPRTGETTYYPTEGSNSMAIKSAAMNAIKQATALYGYDVEDLTLHEIYGERTWEGILTRPAFANDGSSSKTDSGDITYTQPSRYGTLYVGTVLLRADYDVKPANVIWANSMQETFMKYERFLIMNRTARTGSNVLEDKEVRGIIDTIQPIAINGGTSYIVTLIDQPGKLWEVQIHYVGDQRTTDVFTLKAGDAVGINYGDPKNRTSYFAREIHKLADAKVEAPKADASKAEASKDAKPAEKK